MKTLKDLLICFMMVLSLSVSAQNEQQQTAEAAPADSIDRLAEDFVTASICIADPTTWQDDFLGILGHAFIRLQCPTFQMDYIFSFEAENAKTEMQRFMKGQLKMGMFRVNTEEYLRTFRSWNCAIHEYRLNLPPEAELRLWEIMDNEVEEGQDLDFDLMQRGCTQTLVLFVEQALNGTSIEYQKWGEEYKMSRREIIDTRLEKYPWMRFLLVDLLTNTDFNAQVANEEKILVPVQLAEAWTNATVEGRQLATYEGDLIKAPACEVTASWFTPVVLALIILALTLICVALRKPYADLPLVVMQFIIGIVLCWLVAVSNLPGTRGAHLLLLYNPLPLLLWRWRSKWARPYAVILGLWALAMWLLPMFTIEPAHLVFAMAVILMLFRKK